MTPRLAAPKAASSPAAARVVWYAQRLRGMSAEEIGWRVEDRVRQAVWSRRRFDAGPASESLPARARPAPAMPVVAREQLPEAARRALVAAAEDLLRGSADILGVVRHDLADPEWSLDPVSGARYPERRPAFRIDYRRPDDPRHVKQVWELSRHHHLTVLAAAWRATGDERFATMVRRHLESWWAHNPVCSGVNWASGIEVGIRLVSWVWARRLLDGWPGAPALFEGNPVAVHQVYWHQRYLAAFPSRGSSANNHVLAEAAGLLVAACGFPWFAESARWRARAADLFERELAANTFPSGVNREQAFEYHGLVAELALAAGAEAAAARAPLSPGVWRHVATMLDVVAAVVDTAGRPPRYGDGDDGRALVVDDPAADRWASLLAAGAAIVGPLDWWPPVAPDVRSVVLGRLAGRRVEVAGRPAGRPAHFADAGLTLLRAGDGDEEVWCRCDGGPHGYLSIAAHAHADALSVEVRVGGVEVLVDPGTYCYQGDPAWRRYFRSTAAHNTLEVDGQDQSVPGGPFLWTSHARTRLLSAPPGDGDDEAAALRWSAEHDGYRRLPEPVGHRRTVVLDPAARCLEVTDEVTAQGDRPHRLRLAFHLGPAVTAVLDGRRARLTWPRADGTSAGAELVLPGSLEWTAWRGATDPPLGWYSPRFGVREPVTTLLGAARLGSCTLQTVLRLAR